MSRRVRKKNIPKRVCFQTDRLTADILTLPEKDRGKWATDFAIDLAFGDEVNAVTKSARDALVSAYKKRKKAEMAADIRWGNR